MRDDLLSILDLEQLENNVYLGPSVDPGWQRVFGGQVIAQALMAACRTVDGRTVHSLHGYFLLPGDPSASIRYEVERIRDGGSFSTRRVVGIQHGKAIFSMAASFHIAEEGLAHQLQMPDVPPPEDLPDEAAFMEAFLREAPASAHVFWEKPRPVEVRPVDLGAYLDRERTVAGQATWIRSRLDLGNDDALHAAVLAYASDLTLLDTTLLAHGRWVFDRRLQVSSLDHAMWFHRPFRLDDWHLYVCDSPSASGARGFNRGSIFTRDGRLIASVAQEGLVRVIRGS